MEAVNSTYTSLLAPTNPVMEPQDASPRADTASAQQLDQIRIILFGEFMRDVRERFARMEQQVNRTIAEVRAEMQHHHETVLSRIQEERTATDAQFSEAAEQHNAGETAWHERADALQAALDAATAQSEQRLIDTREHLVSTLETQYNDLSAHLQETQARLTDAKADRLDLASLFDQVSAQLRQAQDHAE
ncbi:MAG: hypothetical protein RhofKO_29090 [Rhodothermales bacterium]